MGIVVGYLLFDNQTCYDKTDGRIEFGGSKRYKYARTRVLIVVERYKNRNREKGEYLQVSGGWLFSDNRDSYH